LPVGTPRPAGDRGSAARRRPETAGARARFLPKKSVSGQIEPHPSRAGPFRPFLIDSRPPRWKAPDHGAGGGAGTASLAGLSNSFVSAGTSRSESRRAPGTPSLLTRARNAGPRPGLCAQSTAAQRVKTAMSAFCLYNGSTGVPGHRAGSDIPVDRTRRTPVLMMFRALVSSCM
jgi:hypothetical protein